MQIYKLNMNFIEGTNMNLNSINKKPSSSLKNYLWTKDEDNHLLQEAEKHHYNWEKVSNNLVGRTAKSCASRFYRINKKENIKDNKSLLYLNKLYNNRCPKISKKINNKVNEQINDYYVKFTDKRKLKKIFRIKSNYQKFQIIKEIGFTIISHEQSIKVKITNINSRLKFLKKIMNKGISFAINRREANLEAMKKTLLILKRNYFLKF